MTRMITFVSARRGVGKSILTANLAVLLAGANQRVAMMDANVFWPSLHKFFDLKAGENYSFSDYVEGRCALDDVCHGVADRIADVPKGNLDLIMAGGVRTTSDTWFDTRWAEKIYSMNGIRNYDFLLIDTQAGLGRQDTLLLGAISSTVLIILRADQQDYHGTRSLVAALKYLEISDISLIANQILPIYDIDQVKNVLESSFNTHVEAVITVSEDVLTLGSSGLFVVEYPNHNFTHSMQLFAKGSAFLSDKPSL
jgi:MinD-like ATPase involved in chromosome partitioning or flagellar assembly